MVAFHVRSPNHSHAGRIPTSKTLKAITLPASLVVVLALTACNGSKFTSTGASASSQTVFGGGTGDGAGNTSGNTGGDTSGNTGDSGNGGTSSSFPVSYLCSNKTSESDGSNVLASKTLNLNFYSQTGAILCTETSGIRDSIINLKKLTLTACSNLSNGNYQIRLIDPAANGGSGSGDLFSDNVKVAVSSGTVTKVVNGLNSGKIEVLFNGNNQDTRNKSNLISDASDDCDQRASPLIIDMSKNHNEYVSLSAPTAGIMFDILGSNALPVAHTKKQISWVQNPDFMFLVLPNSSGNVNGIDQMFGDNTTGPDGKHADNGYEALRKFDGKSVDGKKRVAFADGLIDKRDPIFSKLRLWSDKNFDGIAQPNELYTLDEMGVVSIDLNYNALYSETDIYGNQTKYKSVVELKDGSFNLIFDIWFRYL